MLAILTAFAINAAHMQMVRTELVIASDAAARSAGRTFSEEQTVEDAMSAGRFSWFCVSDSSSPPLSTHFPHREPQERSYFSIRFPPPWLPHGAGYWEAESRWGQWCSRSLLSV
ncbi:unnamed protein product [Hapterophycus canaliculatus]